jgi:hypothetical protein
MCVAVSAKKSFHEVKVSLIGETEECPISTMIEYIEKMVECSDKVVTF